jgi:hypothetical protein
MRWFDGFGLAHKSVHSAQASVATAAPPAFENSSEAPSHKRPMSADGVWSRNLAAPLQTITFKNC